MKIKEAVERLMEEAHNIMHEVQAAEAKIRPLRYRQQALTQVAQGICEHSYSEPLRAATSRRCDYCNRSEK